MYLALLMKLSKRQQEVLDAMVKGWEMGHNGGINSRVWLQRNGCGRGGPTMAVNLSTFYALYQRKLIKVKKEGFPCTTWKLAEPLAPSR